MAPIVLKITEQYKADTLEQALDQAARSHQKAFELDRLTEDMAEFCGDFSCDALQAEQSDGEVSTGYQISAQLLDLVQDLKQCNVFTSCEEYDDVSNEDILQDLKLTMQKDMIDMPELLESQDESDFLEQALGLAAQQYAKSFAADRMVSDQMDLDDSELFYDCVDFNIPEDLIEMYMPTTGSCQMSDTLFDIVQDAKELQMTETEDMDHLDSPDFIFELELEILKDMSNSSVVMAEPEIIPRALPLTPHPKQVASVRTKSMQGVRCSLPLGSFANARTPCGGLSCGSPKKVPASPVTAAWCAHKVAASPANAIWRSHRV